MGLFSAVMHVRKIHAAEVARGLDAVMQSHGLVGCDSEPLSGQPPQLPRDSVVGYAYGPLRGDWCTVVQVHFYEDGLKLEG
jgi:hypothetical protein